jgi:hypothetical protein
MNPLWFHVLSTFLLCTSAKQVSRLFDKSVWDEVDKSPLKAQLQPSNSSYAIQAIITNQGSQGTYYSLSADALKANLQLYNSKGKPVAKVYPSVGDGRNPASSFQMLLPGEFVTRELEIMIEYELSPSEQYYIQVGGFMPFYHEGQNPSRAQSQSHIFEANIHSFTAPGIQLPPKKYTQSREISMAPNYLYRTCSDPEMNSKLTQAIPYALEQAKRSIAYIQTGQNREIMFSFFKSDDEDTRKEVVDRLRAIVRALESSGGPQRIGCSEPNGPDARKHEKCVEAGAIAMTDPPSGAVSICPGAKRYNVEFRQCGDSNWGGTLIHELTHSVAIFSDPTEDITYSLQGCKSLSTERALMNANNYKYLADSVFQGRSC